MHVDDMCIVGEAAFVTEITQSISSEFEVSSDEDLDHFLSMSVTRDLSTRTVYLSQEHYIRDLLTKYLDSSFEKVSTLTSKSFKDVGPCQASDKPSSGPYASLLGTLLWVAQCTRPYITFAVNRLSQFRWDASEEHWLAATQILHYLASMSLFCLSLGGSNFSLQGFSDPNWGEDRHDQKSTSGFTYLVGCGPISWKSCKPQTVSLSSTEAEYKYLSDSCCEAMWL